MASAGAAGSSPEAGAQEATIVIGDRLLEWMTHLGGGPWDAFRAAVDELDDGESDDDARKLHRALRIAFSDLGHTDFFVNGSRRWRVRRPALAELIGCGVGHMFIGGRTRELLDRVRLIVGTNGQASMTIRGGEFGPSRVCIEADPRYLREVAAKLGIQYLPKAAHTLAARLPSIRRILDEAERVEEPINWSVRSWSFRNARWVLDHEDRTIREYANRHGRQRYLVSTDRRQSLREVERRAGMYCAALVRREHIVKYCNMDRALRVPRWAPLPAEHARAACLSGGLPGSIEGDSLVFKRVDWQTATAVLASLGQGVPMPRTSP